MSKESGRAPVTEESIRFGFIPLVLIFAGFVALIPMITLDGGIRFLLLPVAAGLVLVGFRPVVKVSSSRVLVKNFLSAHEFVPGDGRLDIHEQDWRLLYLDDDGRWRAALAASAANEYGVRQPKGYVRLESLLLEYGFLAEPPVREIGPPEYRTGTR